MGIHIGCGSWTDDAYLGVLYPSRLPAKERLKCYAEVFESVEVNSSYYATPKMKVVEGWVAQTPKNFTFDIKLHRALAQGPHKAATEGRWVELMVAAVQPLVEAKKLGTFLLVLAPTFGPERHRLEELDALADKIRPHVLAVELRHSGWVGPKRREETLTYFQKRRLSWVAVDMPRIRGSTIMPPMDEMTNPNLAYLRLHGRNPGWLEAKSAAERHAYEYPEFELREVVTRIERLAEKARDVHVYANNHASDFAPKTAMALKRMLGQAVHSLADRAPK